MKKHAHLLVAALWLAVIGIGVAALLKYEYSPGENDGGVKHWPAASQIPRAAKHPTLVMFAHPKCPCTRASIGELALLMAHSQGQVAAYVIFYRPQGTPEDWAHTDLWRSAAAIPGVTVRSDENDVEAQRFQVTTSGHVVLYDISGSLLFTGGITGSRGHSGDNAGRSAIVEILNTGTVTLDRTPTFGCSLLDPDSVTCQKPKGVL